MSFNYIKSELRKLEQGSVYRVKITSDAGGETRWLTIRSSTLDTIAGVLILADRTLDMERAEKLDAQIREIVKLTDFAYFPEKESAPIGSELWHSFLGDVLAVAHNTRKITMERRNELLQEVYVVWTGDESE